ELDHFNVKWFQKNHAKAVMLFSAFRSDKRLKSLSIGHWLGVSVSV
ncbi:hypothetical protein A2U01_0059635, partial [Trifolium medium]|nr:hypothetical protein [Trifolium medium]